MPSGDFQFNFTNLNPLNTSGWSTSALAQRIKAMQDAQKVTDAETAAQASVYGHMKGGKHGKKNGALDMGGLVAGGLAGGPLGAVAGGFGGGLLGGDDPRTPAEKLAHQTKMLAKQEKKFDKTAADLASEQHNIDALNEAISKATDPKVIEHLTKDLEQAQKKLGKVQQKHDANTSHVDEIKKKVTGLDPQAAAKLGPTKENYFNEIVDKTLASRTGASGWHNVGSVSGGTDGTNVKLDPLTGLPVKQVAVLPKAPAAPVTPPVSGVANLGHGAVWGRQPGQGSFLDRLKGTKLDPSQMQTAGAGGGMNVTPAVSTVDLINGKPVPATPAVTTNVVKPYTPAYSGWGRRF